MANARDFSQLDHIIPEDILLPSQALEAALDQALEMQHYVAQARALPEDQRGNMIDYADEAREMLMFYMAIAHTLILNHPEPEHLAGVSMLPDPDLTP